MLFGVSRLASSEVINQALFTFEHQAACKTLKIDHFLLIVTDIVVFGAIFIQLVWYILKQIIIIFHLSVGEYLPRRFVARQIYISY